MMIAVGSVAVATLAIMFAAAYAGSE
jgi:hypothetical protein